VKIKTHLLAILLSVAQLDLHADTNALPETKYVTEEPADAKSKTDKTKLYNFLLATAAIAVATVAILVVSSNKGHKANSGN